MRRLSELIKDTNHDPPKKKIEYEFQAIGVEIQEHFGEEYRNRIWPLFYRYPVPLIRDAWFSYQKGKVKTWNYFVGIIHRTRNDTTRGSG